MAELKRKALLERLELELDLQVVDVVWAWYPHAFAVYSVGVVSTRVCRDWSSWSLHVLAASLLLFAAHIAE